MSLGAPELAEIDRLVRAAAQAEVMPRFRRLAAGAVRQKSGPMDYVTEADEAAERAITQGLRAAFPGCRVVGEEAASEDPTLRGALAASGLAFTVDPIDGTANYVAGLPLFATMVAAVQDGTIVAACIHDPVLQDSFLALAGGGAFSIDAEGARHTLAVSTERRPARMGGSLSWRFLPEPRRGAVMRGALGLGNVHDFRCAGHHYRMLAAGTAEFSLYNRLLPWDHAPGVLLHREAGGHAARFDGSDYDVTRTDGGLLCAPDKESWMSLAETFFK